MNELNLKSNKIDALVSFLKGTIGIVPVVGTGISELISSIIPNQRQDRIANYLYGVSERLNELNITIEDIKMKLNNTKYSFFLYKCCNDTINDMYEEKIMFYQNILVDGMTSDEKKLIQKQMILNELKDLNIIEILYLKYYFYIKWSKRDKSENIIKQLNEVSLLPIYMMNMNNEKYNNEVYKDIVLSRLTNKDLLKIKSTNTGKSSYEISKTGELLLKEIGGIDYE